MVVKEGNDIDRETGGLTAESSFFFFFFFFFVSCAGMDLMNTVQNTEGKRAQWKPGLSK